MARLRPRGLGFAVASYTWASRGETLVSTLAAQTRPPRSTRKGRSRGPCTYWPTAAPLVRNSPRGWTPRSLTTIRSAGRRAAGVRVAANSDRYGGRADKSFPARRAFSSPLRCLARTISTGALGVERLAMAMATSQQPKRRCFVGSTRTNLRDGESLRCPPSRRVPHKWSGRRPIRTRAAQRPFRYETRRTCLSSEGGHRRLCASTSARRRLCASPSSASPACREEPFFLPTGWE